MEGIVKGILHLVASGEIDAATGRWLHPCEVQAMRVDENAWVEAWKRLHQVRPVIAWQPWPWELARDWLGWEEPPQPPPLPEHVRALLEVARPLLKSRRD
ncbi:hypothetical protein ACWDQZ_27370 [Streptomyces tendae]